MNETHHLNSVDSLRNLVLLKVVNNTVENCKLGKNNLLISKHIDDPRGLNNYYEADYWDSTGYFTPQYDLKWEEEIPKVLYKLLLDKIMIKYLNLQNLPSWLLSCWRYIMFSIDQEHKNRCYYVLNTMLHGHDICLNTNHELSLYLPVITLQYYVIEEDYKKEVYVKLNSEFFESLLDDPTSKKYIMNDITEVILVKDKKSMKRDERSDELTKLSSILFHLKGLKVVCHQDVDLYSGKSTRFIDNEVLESLKVCPWLEMIHALFDNSQFTKYVLGLNEIEEEEFCDSEVDLDNTELFLRKILPSWPNLNFLFIDQVMIQRPYLAFGILKHLSINDINLTELIKSKLYQVLFNGRVSSFEITDAKFVFENGLLVDKGRVFIRFSQPYWMESKKKIKKLLEESEEEIKKFVEDPKYKVFVQISDSSKMFCFSSKVEKFDWLKQIIKTQIYGEDIKDLYETLIEYFDQITEMKLQASESFFYRNFIRSISTLQIPVQFLNLVIEKNLKPFCYALEKFPLISTLKITQKEHLKYDSIQSMDFGILKTLTGINSLIYEHPEFQGTIGGYELFKKLNQHKPPYAKCYFRINSWKHPFTVEKLNYFAQEGWNIIYPACKRCQLIQKESMIFPAIIYSENGEACSFVKTEGACSLTCYAKRTHHEFYHDHQAYDDYDYYFK